MKSIKTKMMLFVGVVIALTLIALTAINSINGKSLISAEVDKKMENAIDEEINSINSQLEQVETMLEAIARTVSATYTYMTLEEYEDLLKNIILDNDVVLGSGIWFKEYAYDPAQKYVGPYVYKDGTDVVVTYDYSNSDYDYFTQDYYTQTMNDFEPHITDPYYDETSGLIMASSSVGIRGTDGKFIGCITVDIELSSIETIINNIKVGKTDMAALTTADGLYIVGASDSSAILNPDKSVDKEENESLAAAAKAALESDSGKQFFSANGEDIYMYYDIIPETGWKLFISISKSEVEEGVNEMTNKSVIIGTALLLVCLVVVFILINNITKDVNKVNRLASNLADGDFTVDKLSISGRDEMAQMGNALNSMYDANKNMLTGIRSEANKITTASVTLEQSAVDLSEKFDEIKTQMSKINESMMTCSASTQEINAGIEDVNSNVNVLADETNDTLKRAKEIKESATLIEKQSRESAANASALSEKFETELTSSIENAAVVENISMLADVIASIAEQINLLSLNASIEAARAGEQGRGFAVVAGEIGKLANDTSEAVSNIQNTIADVHSAFGKMSTSAKNILSFVQETISKDYTVFVDVAGKYGNDAQYFANSATEASHMAEAIRGTMNDLASAAQNVAESSQDTATASGAVFSTINRAGENAASIKNMSSEELKIAENLNSEVAKFKL